MSRETMFNRTHSHMPPSNGLAACLAAAAAASAANFIFSKGSKSSGGRWGTALLSRRVNTPFPANGFRLLLCRRVRIQTNANATITSSSSSSLLPPITTTTTTAASVTAVSQPCFHFITFPILGYIGGIPDIHYRLTVCALVVCWLCLFVF